ncbi:MAG: hypothetical protein V3U62_10875 [Sedimenticolaceae bacterium]
MEFCPDKDVLQLKYATFPIFSASPEYFKDCKKAQIAWEKKNLLNPGKQGDCQARIIQAMVDADREGVKDLHGVGTRVRSHELQRMEFGLRTLASSAIQHLCWGSLAPSPA